MSIPQKPASSGSPEKRVHIPYASAGGSLPFSSAVVVGNTAYLCGHIGLEPGTRNVPADLETEIHAMMSALRDTLTRATLTMNDLVFVQVFCSDISLFDRFNAVYITYFKYPFPARAFIGSGPLLFGAHFEIQGIATKSADA
jgi:2-iminobutanoate/2-iminopropanoate deaminase